MDSIQNRMEIIIYINLILKIQVVNSNIDSNLKNSILSTPFEIKFFL